MKRISGWFRSNNGKWGHHRGAALRTGCVALILVGACLLPRVAMALRREVLSTDAVFYIERAQAFERGDFQAGLADLGLNLYPWLLVALHCLGCDYELAGRLLGLACTSLAVLPLAWLAWRWVGGRAAVVAGVLYAMHPESIEWSPEIIRDGVFALAMWLTLAAAERARDATRWRWSFVAAAAWAAAVLLRFEGWLLLMPLVLLGWPRAAVLRDSTLLAVTPNAATTAGTAPATVRPRRRWATHSAIVLAAPLVATWLLNITVLSGYDRWEWGRFDHWRMAARWFQPGSEPARLAPATDSTLQGLASHPPRETVAHSPQTVSGRAPRPAAWRARAWGVRHTVARGATPWYLLLIVWGALCAWRGAYHSRAAQTGLHLFALAIGVSLWIYLAQVGEINKRYVLPAVWVELPCAGLGLVVLADALAARAGHLAQALKRRRAPPILCPAEPVPGRPSAGWAPGFLAIVLALTAWHGSRTALASRYDSRYMKAELGTWIRLRLGSGQTLLASDNLERLVGYYAQSRHVALPAATRGDDVARWVDWQQADVVVLWLAERGDRYDTFLNAAESRGFVQLPRAALPPSAAGTAVLVQRGLWARAQRPSDAVWQLGRQPARGLPAR